MDSFMNDIDVEGTIMDISQTLQRLRMFPYFEIANYILMCCIVKDDTPQKGDTEFSRKHPLASWLGSMIMCFAGEILTKALTGGAVLAAITDQRCVLMATAVWYIINFCPLNLAHKLFNSPPILSLLILLKELQRVRKVRSGVDLAAEQFGDGSVILIVVMGVVKGSGYLEMKLFERLIRGVWLPATSELLQPSATTKLTAAAAVAFLADRQNLLMQQLDEHLFFIVYSVFIMQRLLYALFGITNPLAPIENLICSIFLGGIVDSFRLAFSGSSNSSNNNSNGIVNSNGKLNSSDIIDASYHQGAINGKPLVQRSASSSSTNRDVTETKKKV